MITSISSPLQPQESASSSASTSKLPILVIFERYWDENSKKVVKNLLPDLVYIGYKTLCFEVPHNLSGEEIQKRLALGLERDSKLVSEAKECLKRKFSINRVLSDLHFDVLCDLMRQYVSSQQYELVAEKIKQLPAFALQSEICKEATRLSMNIRGVDIREIDYDKMLEQESLADRVQAIRIEENSRIKSFVEQLLSLDREGNGVVFLCGAWHAELISKLQAEEAKVHYYFLHSGKNYLSYVEDAKELSTRGEGVLMGHTHCVPTEQEVKNVAGKIVEGITGYPRKNKEDCNIL